MSEYLVFRLYAPLASWGEAAVGETRPTATYPGRSAILGLLGSALGIQRDDEAGQNSLFQSIKVAVKQYRAGTLLSDYHTAQVPPAQSKVRYFSRRDELHRRPDKIGTILSSRQYRNDGLWTVAIWCSSQARYSLRFLADALKRPRFALYLGRRACPLAAPLASTIVDRESLQAALDHDFPDLIPGQHSCLRPDATCLYVWEGEAGTLNGDPQGVEVSSAWDNPLDRNRWQFQPRKVFRRFQRIEGVA